MYHNYIHGSTPSTSQNNDSLEILGLNNNAITGYLLCLITLTKLNILDPSNNSTKSLKIKVSKES